MNNNKKCYLYETAKIIMLIYLAILNVNYDTVEQYCTLWRCDKTFFVLAYTPPPGLTTCHECPRSSPAH